MVIVKKVARPWRVALCKINDDNSKKDRKAIEEKSLLLCSFQYSERCIMSRCMGVGVGWRDE